MVVHEVLLCCIEQEIHLRQERGNVSGPKLNRTEELSKQESLRSQTIKSLNLFGLDLFSLLIVVITSENCSITPALLLSTLTHPRVIITIVNSN